MDLGESCSQRKNQPNVKSLPRIIDLTYLSANGTRKVNRSATAKRPMIPALQVRHGPATSTTSGSPEDPSSFINGTHSLVPEHSTAPKLSVTTKPTVAPSPGSSTTPACIPNTAQPSTVPSGIRRTIDTSHSHRSRRRRPDRARMGVASRRQLATALRANRDTPMTAEQELRALIDERIVHRRWIRSRALQLLSAHLGRSWRRRTDLISVHYSRWSGTLVAVPAEGARP